MSLWQNSTNDRKINNLWFCFVATTCVFMSVSQFTTHENYFALLICEVKSVNFLKTLNHLRKDCLEVNMKQLNEVGIESDR